MNIKETIEKLNAINSIPFEIKDWQPLSGGTSSTVWKLFSNDNQAYVLKHNEGDVIKEESQFLETYRHIELLPQVLYVDAKYDFFIYPFMPGTVRSSLNNKRETLNKLVDGLINNYQPLSTQKWGWTWEPSNHWHQFLSNEINSAKKVVQKILPTEDIELVEMLGQKERRNKLDCPFLLHGDCGVHNLLQIENDVVGVIDPMSLAGPPIFELVFAFCSTPEQLTFATIFDAANKLPTFDGNYLQLIEEVIIGIYIRLERCLYHHPDDLTVYLKAWEYWKGLLIAK